MPVYEYRCASCAGEIEEIVLPGEQPPAACPACGGELVRRWSRVGVQLVFEELEGFRARPAEDADEPPLH